MATQDEISSMTDAVLNGVADIKTRITGRQYIQIMDELRQIQDKLLLFEQQQKTQEQMVQSDWYGHIATSVEQLCQLLDDIPEADYKYSVLSRVNLIRYVIDRLRR